MTIKLIATDVDGTFLDDQHQYEIARFNEQLQEMQRRNIHFAIASGNHYSHLQMIFGTKSPIMTFIAENGALTMDRGQVIAERRLTPTIIQQLLRQLKDDPNLQPDSIHLSGQRASYMNQAEVATLTDEINYFYNNLQLVPDISQVDDHIYKLNAIWDHAALKPKADYLNAKFPGIIHATASGFGSIDIIAGGVNKGVGLQQLEDHLQLTAADVAAFGDNYNDLEMLNHAKYSYAMRNAVPEIQQHAAFITRLDNNHYGVLDTIDQLLK
ncbi:Cof-type HAD-IIB family hydrolase [Loigolactobacillus zhaoyuanensis]|uniref:Cof-type HAD-IIB family hydrolase n=1 Tax=Loigolactobacillus zhaoyuanensis TaxID=2486017 RepID=A0ABW8UIM8_9LACO|nr:Cof-type HAD-IIB family hydrolase [Loigolactobacillus zhaoyuanensis]